MSVRMTAQCGSCKCPDLHNLFSLGQIPPVNAFLSPSEIAQEIGYPLELCICSRCLLVQIREPVPPEKLFSHYLHLSSASGSNLKHLKTVSESISARDSDLRNKRVLEIGSNDGTLLSFLKKETQSVLGVDPARNLTAQAEALGVPTITDFFLEESAKRIEKDHGSFDWIVALNVVPHTPDVTSLLRGVHALLKPGGRFLLEGAYVVDTILNGQFDTIYHEHVYNFSLHSLRYALENSGLRMLDVEIIPTQGTSFRVICSRRSDPGEVSPNVTAFLERERTQGYLDLTSYEAAALKVHRFADEFRERVQRLKQKSGHKLIALGAPARGVVILNYCRVGTDDIEYIIDDTVLKQGRLTPGVHVPVAGWERLNPQTASAFVLLSWNYRDEVLRKLRESGARGTLLVPFPRLEEITIA